MQTGSRAQVIARGAKPARQQKSRTGDHKGESAGFYFRADLSILNISRKRKELAVDRTGEEALIKPSIAVSATRRALPPTAITATGQEPVDVPVPGLCPRDTLLLSLHPVPGAGRPERARTPTGAGRDHSISKVDSAGRAAVGNRFLTQLGPRSASASPFPPGLPDHLSPYLWGIHYPSGWFYSSTKHKSERSLLSTPQRTFLTL